MSAPNISSIPKSNLTGIMWMLLYTLAMTGMHSGVRHISETIHPFEAAFFRLVFGLLALAPFFYRHGLSVLNTKRLPMLCLRGVINAVCMLGFFFALSIGPLAQVTALGFSATLFGIILAVIIFKEKVGLNRWAAIFVGFVGTIVIIRPGFAHVGIESIVTLGAAFGWAVCMMIIKDLGRTESAATITAYMSLVMAPIVLIPALFVWTTPTLYDLAWLVAIGIMGGIGQLAMANALKFGEAQVVLPVEFSRLVWISIIAFFAFGEVPGIYLWIGGGMIIAATTYITIREGQIKKRGDNN
ncbi:DMT family transporter [Sneathiella sp. HT1-7]|uniref:DMT family transporter n=1 Tax=Sneathiella sp. HT1-7 TaxID=2887192 RepID=UPI001D13B911|nr:DMT family transporter [Sneathiella sp. HT1-7]MCC3305221.1 DMT family transporter [Sneathiella sp. HT1-7]